MHSVELTPAHAPAISDGGIGNLGCSPALGVKTFLTESKAKYCRESTVRKYSKYKNYVHKNANFIALIIDDVATKRE